MDNVAEHAATDVYILPPSNQRRYVSSGVQTFSPKLKDIGVNTDSNGDIYDNKDTCVVVIQSEERPLNIPNMNIPNSINTSTENRGSNKKRSYDAAFKLTVVDCAENRSNRFAARTFGVDEKRVRDWRQQKDSLLSVSSSRRRLSGGGRKRLLDESFDESIIKWINELSLNGVPVTRKMVQEKARLLYADKLQASSIKSETQCDDVDPTKVCDESKVDKSSKLVETTNDTVERSPLTGTQICAEFFGASNTSGQNSVLGEARDIEMTHLPTTAGQHIVPKKDDSVSSFRVTASPCSSLLPKSVSIREIKVNQEETTIHERTIPNFGSDLPVSVHKVPLHYQAHSTPAPSAYHSRSITDVMTTVSNSPLSPPPTHFANIKSPSLSESKSQSPPQTFNASNGWIDNFLRRHKITLHNPTKTVQKPKVLPGPSYPVPISHHIPDGPDRQSPTKQSSPVYQHNRQAPSIFVYTTSEESRDDIPSMATLSNREATLSNRDATLSNREASKPEEELQPSYDVFVPS